MEPPFPLTVTDWREFLRNYSTEFLNSDKFRRLESDGTADYLVNAAQRESGWLGYEPTSEETVAAAEERLGVRLTPTYRNFLLASSGFAWLDSIILFGADKVGWFLDIDPEMLEAWSDFDDIIAVLRRSLMIGHDNGGSGGWWLLHADRVGEDGEWIAYEWWPGEGGDLEENATFAALVREHEDCS